ncbi:MAG: hypothetical protein WCK70_20250 [Chloroflexales bacterium]
MGTHTFIAAPPDMTADAARILAATRALFTLPLVLEEKTFFLEISPDTLIAIHAHRNPRSPERHFCGYLASIERPLERVHDHASCGPWHTSTPGALIAMALDAYQQVQDS